MKTNLFLLLAMGMFFTAFSNEKISRKVLDLSGEWHFYLDPENKVTSENWQSKTFAEFVNLPGTTDENKKGILNTNKTETTHLSREYSWFGKAFYQRKIVIDNSWNGKYIRLIMERTKPTMVWVDEVPAGSNTNITTSQIYDLSKSLVPGEHTLTIMVDTGRSVPSEVINSSHAYAEHTQTNWNGIIGKFLLEASDQCYIDDVQSYPNIDTRSVKVKFKLNNQGNTDKKFSINYNSVAWNTKDNGNIIAKSVTVTLKPGENLLEETLNLGSNALLWDEFKPSLYRLSISISSDNQVIDETTSTFGLRKFSTSGTQFVMNGNPTFLRGKHDACVFPLIGHVAMDNESWIRYFGILKTWGINHVRFHSWCPPEAAFEAADRVGIYLQPELPFWGKEDPKKTELIEYLRKEGLNIQKTYSNHPSFVMFALGNELSGDFNVMRDFIGTFRAVENRHLFAYGSNNYLGFKGAVEGEDYLTTCRIGGETSGTFDTHVRASFSFADAYDGGYINGSYPNTLMDYSGASKKSAVPVISHETGQFQVYPDYDELKKYTGVLKPWNLEVFKKRLYDAGMGNQGKDFFRASGALSAICYKADIEMCLRTKGFGGFQLLDLQDFPGQGTALVGMLDAFMENKGIIQPERFREFCNDVVPLLIIDKFCWTNNETFKAKVKVANYSTKAFKNQSIKWIIQESGKTLLEGVLKNDISQGNLTDAGEISVSLSGIKKAIQAELVLTVEGTNYKNRYPIWVYPQQPEISVPSQILVTSVLDEKAIAKLKQGGKVLLFPDHKSIEPISVGGLFTPDYWNYRMFKGISEGNKKPVSSGTLGILTKPEHPLFEQFPTAFHSDWQWWAIVKNSRPMVLDSLDKNYLPIVQVVDNIERNHKLGLIFEFNVEGGKLLICTSNLPAIVKYPEAKQLYNSILNYMASEKFKPASVVKADGLFRLFNQKVAQGNLKELKNISY
ncbi:MAG: sugar-binding domain-containing protein [Mariniphaga sp.]